MLFTYIVENFVAAVIVKRYGNVLNACLVELVARLYNTLAVIADGVHIPCDEIDGQIFRNSVYNLFTARLFNYGEKNFLSVIGEIKAAKRVRPVTVDVYGVF